MAEPKEDKAPEEVVELQNGTVDEVTQPAVKDFNYWEPKQNWTARRVQRALRKKGYFKGPIDGVFHRPTRDAIQTLLNRATSLDVYVEVGSKMGRDESYGIQEYAAKYGSYDGEINGRLNTEVWEAFALGLERQG